MTDRRPVPTDPRDDHEVWELVAMLPVPAAAHDFLPRLQERIAAPPGATTLPPGRAARARSGSHRRLLASVAAVAAAAAVFAFVVLPAIRGAATATAADMLASMNAAAGSAKTVRLRIVEGFAPAASASPQSASGGEPAPSLRKDTSEELTLSTAGDFLAKQTLWSEAIPAPDGSPLFPARWLKSVFGYDARRHELRIHTTNGYQSTVLRPAWATDPTRWELFYLRYQAAASSLRAQLAEADPATPVTATTYLGRPAWHVVIQGAWPEDRIAVTVDKATGLLMARERTLTWADGRRVVSFLRVTRLEVDPRLPAGWQIVPLLTRTTPTMQSNLYVDEGTRFGTPEQVAARSWPTLPLVPRWAPAGYRLTDVANAVYEDPRPDHENPWRGRVVRIEPDGRVPGVVRSRRTGLSDCEQGVLVRFRRGFASFVVEISPKLPGEPGMGSLTRDTRPTVQDVTLTGGYLKGARARTWISAAQLPVHHISGNSMMTESDGPTLLTYSDRSMITIYGDLTRQELIDVANSLTVYGDVNRPLPAGYGD